jgi:predicted nucleic acid-binding protein
MGSIPNIYWDSSCFISLLSADAEPQRHEICNDILQHARNDEVVIWTSCWTIVEVLRPREKVQPHALPSWTGYLKRKRKDGSFVYPGAHEEFERIWNYYHRHTRPSRLLDPDQASKIRKMFAWPFIRKIQVAPVIAHKAAEISRTYNIKCGDSIHIASAVHRGCTEIHCYDERFCRTNALILSKEPARMSDQTLFS